MNESQICRATGRLLPDDLAGYQCVVDGSVLINDILVDKQTRERCWSKWDGDPFKVITTYYDVYRLIPCPKAGALDEGWKTVQGKEYLDMEREASLRKDIKRSIQESSDSEEAKTDDEGKPPLAELPWAALEEVSRVQAFGFKKYQDFHNYRKGMKVSRHLSCAVRHIAKWMMGEDNDKESGCSHLAHAACRILFVLQNIAEGTAKDNRYKPKSK